MKNLTVKKESRLKSILIDLSDWIDDQYRNIRWYWKNLKRAIEWGRFGWNHYDWEFESSFNVLQFKLDRLCREFKKCKIHYHSKDLKAINKLRKSLKFVRSEYWDNEAEKNISKKWGRFIKDPSKQGGFPWRRSKVTNEKDRKTYYKGLQKEYKKATEQHKKSIAEFCNILKDTPTDIGC